MIRFDGVQRHFGPVTALAGLDLQIAKGELIALLGPSGCGKTTALRILGGFDRPDAGRVFVNDLDVSSVPPNKRDMGMVFQAYSLFPNMNVRTNVAFGLRMRRQDKSKRLRRADQLLELVGLTETSDRYPYQLSGGQQQRVAIARALAIEPTVLLLDEPLSALDARVRTQLRAEIRSLQQRLGITTLFVTHDQSEALSIADRVGVMQHGRLEQVDTPESVYRHPATPFVAEFVGAMNRLPGRIGDNGEVQVLGQRLKVLNPDGTKSGAAVYALLRPEAVAVVPDAAGPGEVTERAFLGSAVRLQVTLDTGQKVLVELPSHGVGVTLGARTGLRILVESVIVEEMVPSQAP
ncbi:MAG: ABC transporter ATP-binding protein [Solirubrobacteraceae bacterium]|jgi:putative spermidine/putrescine transport system ATP-binding protein